VSYLNSLLIIKQFLDADITKGKMTIDHIQGFMKQVKLVDVRKKVCKRWEPPGADTTKINVDDAFSRDDCACIGIIVRDQQGAVLFDACRPLESVRMLWKRKSWRLRKESSSLYNERRCGSTWSRIALRQWK
jgi:hypothetical protein